MRKFGRIVVGVVAVLVLVAAGAWFISQWISKKQTEESLAKQAADIAAHRQAQQAETPAAPAVPQTAAPAPDLPPVAAIAWTRHWTDFRGAPRDGQFTAGPIRTDWTALKPLWRQPIGGGYASFVAADGRAFTIEQRGKDEVAAAYDVLTGHVVCPSV